MRRRRQEREDAAEIRARDRRHRPKTTRCGVRHKTAPPLRLPPEPATARDGGGHDEQDDLATDRAPRRDGGHPGRRNGVERGHGIGGRPAPRAARGERLDVLPSPGIDGLVVLQPRPRPAVPGNPDTRPTYAFLLRRDDTFTGNGHLIRADLYQGQTCANGQPYVLRALIGYSSACTDRRDGPSRRVRCAASRRPWPPAAVAARTLVLMGDPPDPARAALERILVEPTPQTCGSSRRRCSCVGDEAASRARARRSRIPRLPAHAGQQVRVTQREPLGCRAWARRRSRA